MPPNLKQNPSPQLRIRLILMIFLLSENDADMTEIIHFALFGKNSLLSWPFVCFFLNIPELPGCSLYLFPKLIKSEIVWLFFRNTLLSLLFFSIFSPKKTPFSHALIWSKYVQKTFYFFYTGFLIFC